MAIVPTLQRQVKSQGFSGRQSIQTNAKMLGGAQADTFNEIADAGFKAADAMESIFLTQQNESDKRQLLEIEADLDNFEHDLFNNQQTGIYNQRLGKSQNITSMSQDAYDKKAKSILKSTEGNARIQNKLQEHLNARRKRITSGAANWEREETRKYSEQLLTDKADRAREGAVNSYNPEDMKHFNQSMKEMEATIRRLGNDRDEDKEVVDKRVFDAKSAVHIGVINRMLKNGQDIEAEDYLEDHGDAIDIDERIKLEGMVREQTYATQAQKDAERYLALAGGDANRAIRMLRAKEEGKREERGVAQLKTLREEGKAEDDDKAMGFVDKLTGTYAENVEAVRNSGMSPKQKRFARAELRARRQDQEEENEEKARKFADILAEKYPDDTKKQREMLKAFTEDRPDLRKRTQTILDNMATRNAREEARAQREATKSASEWIESGKSYDAMPVDMKNAVRQVVGMEATLRKRESDKANGIPAVSEKGIRGTLHNMYRQDPLKFSNLNLYGPDYLGRLSDADLKWAEGLQRTLDRNALQADKAAKKVAKQTQQVDKILKAADNVLQAAKARGNEGASTTELARYNQITEDVLKAVESLPEDKELTRQEQIDLVRGLLLQGEIAGSGVVEQDDAKAYQADEKFDISDFVDHDKNAPVLDDWASRAGIKGPQARKNTAKIVQWLIRNRRPTTVDNIKAIYDRLVARQN